MFPFKINDQWKTFQCEIYAYEDEMKHERVLYGLLPIQSDYTFTKVNYVC